MRPRPERQPTPPPTRRAPSSTWREGTTASPAVARIAPSLLTATAALALQQAAGNRAVTSVVSVQRAGPDGTITDPAEMERSRPVGGDVDFETRILLIRTLRAAPRSRTILDEIFRTWGDLLFPLKWSARGTYHLSGEIWLDRTKNQSHWVADMTHEITHLHTFQAGQAANISTLSRADFVNAKMTDEINAHAASYVALLQLGRTTAPAEGFADFRLHLTRTLPTAVRENRWAEVEALAKSWVEQKYRTGGWTTSNTGENYYDYWGAAWDRAHSRTPAPVPG